MLNALEGNHKTESVCGSGVAIYLVVTQGCSAILEWMHEAAASRCGVKRKAVKRVY